MVTLGLDEVGRGCWAGPLVAGAVVLGEPIAGLKDSKQLTASQRERLAAVIHDQALAVGLGWVEPTEIDQLGLTQSTRLAMERALAHISLVIDEIIIDGNINFLASDGRARAVIKADMTIPAVSAASIVAKVARDAYMIEAAKNFPAYGFEKHVGYGTAVHQAALRQYGACQLHRCSYKPVQACFAGQII